MNENSPESDMNIFDCSIQHRMLLTLILLLWLAEEQKGCNEGLKRALASAWVQSPEQLPGSLREWPKPNFKIPTNAFRGLLGRSEEK